jgi:hypothetical protein
MHARSLSPRPEQRGYALVLTMCLIGVSLLILASTVRWTSTESGLTARNNLYNTTIAGAEAATERVLAQMNRDFVYQSVSSDLNTYRVLLPVQTGWPVQFAYSDGAGTANQTRVQSLGPSVVGDLDSEFTGLYGMLSPYRVVSRATPVNESYNLSATVQQNFQLAVIPIFQYAIFYTMDLEINPGQAMVVSGKVHSNGKIYVAPPASLEFKDVVTSVNSILNERHPDDPTGGSKTAPVYDDKHVEKVSALALPIGTNNSPVAVQQILDPPPAGGDTNLSLGKQRFYNLADLIISNSPSGVVTVKSGAWNGFTTVPSDAGSGYSFVTNVTFYDYREQKTVQATEINVGKFNTWLANTSTNGGSGLNAAAKTATGKGLNSAYTIDKRPLNSSSLPAVRVTNGQQLPADGFTVATPNPLYVKGHFNLNNGTDTTPDQKDTSKTKPSALIGDSITVLSSSWQDTYTSGTALSSRAPADTTVNAAILGGIVESKQASGIKHYSGGVENFPRFLENWSSGPKSLTYNGSMVVMFPSRYATNFWVAPGTYYGAPKRLWAFDVGFLDVNKLPPLTPQVRKLVRGEWKVIASNGP